jgi:HlyD family secretion protein
MEQVAKSVVNQKKSLEAEIEGLDLQIRMKDSEVRDAERDLDQVRVRAERRGIVTWVNANIGSFVNAGDVVAKIADLASYRIEAKISDIHADKLRPGGPVAVRIGKHRLSGVINSVRPTVENGIAMFDISLDESSHPSLRPNLRADVFVVTSHKDGVMRVSNGPFHKGLVDQRVFVIKADIAERRTVDIGASNYDFVELIGEISPGDELIISDMSRYDHAEQVRITE